MRLPAWPSIFVAMVRQACVTMRPVAALALVMASQTGRDRDNRLTSCALGCEAGPSPNRLLRARFQNRGLKVPSA